MCDPPTPPLSPPLMRIQYSAESGAKVIRVGLMALARGRSYAIRGLAIT